MSQALRSISISVDRSRGAQIAIENGIVVHKKFIFIAFLGMYKNFDATL